MRCAACPVPSGTPCRGESDRPEFCGPSWAGSGDPTLLAHVRFVADGRPPAEPPADFRRLKSDRDRVNACPHRTPLGSCRCDGYCALGRGREHPVAGGASRWVVTLAECLECLNRR